MIDITIFCLLSLNTSSLDKLFVILSQSSNDLIQDMMILFLSLALMFVNPDAETLEGWLYKCGSL